MPWRGCRRVFTELVEQRLAVLGGELGKLEDEVLADRDHIGREALGPLAARAVALCPRIRRPAQRHPSRHRRAAARRIPAR